MYVRKHPCTICAFLKGILSKRVSAEMLKNYKMSFPDILWLSLPLVAAYHLLSEFQRCLKGQKLGNLDGISFMFTVLASYSWTLEKSDGKTVIYVVLSSLKKGQDKSVTDISFLLFRIFLCPTLRSLLKATYNKKHNIFLKSHEIDWHSD